MPFEEVQGETEHVEGLTGFLVSTVLARHISRFVIRHCRLKRGHHRTFSDLQQQLCHALTLFLIPCSMGARTFRALSRDLRGSKLVCRHNLREHKEPHIVVEREARGGWQRPYICIELLALLTLCRRGKGFNLAYEPLQHCWLHPVFPPQPTRISSQIFWSCAQNPATKSMSSKTRSSSGSSICSRRIFSRVS